MNKLIKFIEEKALYKSDRMMFGKRPGDRYRWQFYMSHVTQNGPMMRYVCNEWERKLHDHNINPQEIQFAGKHWSSLPILGAVAYHFNVNTFSVREERKTYGLHNLIEGTVDNKPVLIVDAVSNSTNTFQFVQDHLRTQDIPVMDKCLCILNKKRKDDAGYLWDQSSQQEIISLVSLCQIDLS